MISEKISPATCRQPNGSRNIPLNRIVVIEDSFPVISETFILDQISGLMDRGLAVENWSLRYMEQQIRHSKVLDYGLVEKTRYLTLPPREFRTTPDRWVNQLLRQNAVENFDSISAFHVHFGPNFIEFEPLFRTVTTFLIVSFYGYDASKYILENGERCYDYLFTRANLITTPTESMRNELIRIGCPQHKIVVHRCGVRIPEQAKKTDNTREMVTMLTVARFVEKKGVEFALRAVALCANRANFRYRIIGDGPLKPHLVDLADKLGIKDTVEFLGFLPIEKIRKEMAAADIVVLTSVTATNGDMEGLPVTLVEAQAMGLPVISSYHSGIPELVVHGVSGLLSDERDSEQIASHMEMLITNQGMRSELGSNGRQRVISEFDIEALNDRLASYFSLPDKIHYKPRLSLLIPTYNRQKYLAAAIHSALAQNYPNFEVVVVDDGSTDETPDIVRSFSDPRLRYVVKEHNGAPATRNRCIAEAKGEFLVWLDSDDMLMPNVLEVYAEALAKTPEADVLYGDLIVTDHEFRQTGEACHQDWYGRNNGLIAHLFHSNCIPNPGTMVRKTLYDAVGKFDEFFRRAHDYELWTRFALKANFKHVPMKVVKWRWHDSNMSSGSVKLDTSFDARIIKNMTENFTLQQLLPYLDWKSPRTAKTEATAWICVAKRLLELGDTAGAIESASKSNLLYPVPETTEILKTLQSMTI